MSVNVNLMVKNVIQIKNNKKCLCESKNLIKNQVFKKKHFESGYMYLEFEKWRAICSSVGGVGGASGVLT